MLVEAVILLGVGLMAMVLPAVPAYRRATARRLATRIGAQVPPGQRPALEARTARRARGVGLGVLLSGLMVQAWHLVTGSPLPPEYQGWVLFGLSWVLGVAGLVIAELRWRDPDAPRARAARSTVPTLTDYVPGYLVAMSWGFAAVAAAAVLGTMVLARSRWFDAEVVLASPVPLVGLALAALAFLSHLVVRRVLDTPQPARDERELYWQDGVRAATLSTVTILLAQTALFVVFVVARTLDAAAAGDSAPGWVPAVPSVGYGAFVVLAVVGAVVGCANAWGEDTERTRFRSRLWTAPDDGRCPEMSGV